MNEADQAQKADETGRDLSIQAIREAATRREMPPKGGCYFCARPFPKGDQRIFCDGDCAADHEQERRMRHGC